MKTLQQEFTAKSFYTNYSHIIGLTSCVLVYFVTYTNTSQIKQTGLPTNIFSQKRIEKDGNRLRIAHVQVI